MAADAVEDEADDGDDVLELTEELAVPEDAMDMVEGMGRRPRRRRAAICPSPSRLHPSSDPVFEPEPAPAPEPASRGDAHPRRPAGNVTADTPLTSPTIRGEAVHAALDNCHRHVHRLPGPDGRRTGEGHAAAHAEGLAGQEPAAAWWKQMVKKRGAAGHSPPLTACSRQMRSDRPGCQMASPELVSRRCACTAPAIRSRCRPCGSCLRQRRAELRRRFQHQAADCHRLTGPAQEAARFPLPPRCPAAGTLSLWQWWSGLLQHRPADVVRPVDNLQGSSPSIQPRR